MDKPNFLTWQEAQKMAEEGKKLYFHHTNKTVPVDKNTKFQDLQWSHFGMNLTWHDILNGKYSVASE